MTLSGLRDLNLKPTSMRNRDHCQTIYQRSCKLPIERYTPDTLTIVLTRYSTGLVSLFWGYKRGYKWNLYFNKTIKHKGCSQSFK